jgi:hypothetical protein
MSERLQAVLRDNAAQLCEIERLRAGRRSAAQALIEEIGAPGPESITETAARAAAEIVRLRGIVHGLRNAAQERTSADDEMERLRAVLRRLRRVTVEHVALAVDLAIRAEGLEPGAFDA